MAEAARLDFVKRHFDKSA